MIKFRQILISAVVLTPMATTVSQAATLLYQQDFENPASFRNDGVDTNIYKTVNDNYGNQPVGFQFAQQYTVETLNVTGSDRGTGSAAWGTGWSDPSGTGGNFAVGMLSDGQNDLLGLSFDVGALPYFNVSMDVSSIDLSGWGGPFVPAGEAPVFRFSLFDNPSGGASTGSGSLLDSYDFTGVASAGNVFDWRKASFGLSTAGNTNGNVTFQIDMLSGGYGALDNFVLTADDTPPPLAPVPLPGSFILMLGGLGLIGRMHRRVRRG